MRQTLEIYSVILKKDDFQ